MVWVELSGIIPVLFSKLNVISVEGSYSYLVEYVCLLSNIWLTKLVVWFIE
jgi:hypothetical protein